MFSDATIKEFELTKRDSTRIIDEDNQDYVTKNIDEARCTKTMKFEKY